MIKMTPLDMSWFPLESKTIRVHGGFLHVFTPPPGAKPDYARKLLAAMKKRPVGAPFNLRPRLRLGGMPYWQEVTVDLDRHIVTHRLPAPGNEQQLRAAMAEAINQPLSWNLPLWRCHWVEGLEGGRFAFMLVVHHAQWDGMAMFRLMGETMSPEANNKAIRAPWQGVSTWLKHAAQATEAAPAAEKKPRAPASNRAGEALLGIAGAVLDLGKVVSRRASQALDPRGIALPLAAPESRPERHGSGERVYGLTSFPVARVKALAKASECSFNDVMTTVVDAAYANYLDELGMPPGKPLVALVPMALKVPGAGNQLSGALVVLGEPDSTPQARLTAINASMNQAKANIGIMGATGAKLYAMIVMGIAAAPDLLRIGERLPTTANMLISNPLGVPQHLYLNGSRMDYFMPLIGPSLGARLMIGIWSYADETYVSLTSLRSVVPDVERLATLTQQAFDTLERGILGTAATPVKPPAKRAKPAKKTGSAMGAAA